jgi:uncharacterized lipoprotein YddW (UPF0748 family)
MRLLLVALAVVLALASTPVAYSGPPAQSSRIYAVWSHSDLKPWQSDVYARDPDYVLRELDWMRDVGINTHLALAFASGRVNWHSERLPDTRALYERVTPVDTSVRGGPERGIDTELYFIMGFVGFLEDAWAAPELRANPEWDLVLASGKGTLSGALPTTPVGTPLWWDVGHPAVQERLLEAIGEALERYPTAAGIHLDYIRSAEGGCYSDPCLARFQEATGIVLPASLADAAARASYLQAQHAGAYTAWRAGEVTELVRRIRALVDERRPGLRLSAAVFANAAGAYRGVYQDWHRWAAEGLVDVLYPMFYEGARPQETIETYLRETLALLDQQAAAAGRARPRLVLGIATSWFRPLTPAEAADSIRRALGSGADGIALQSLPYWWQAQYQRFRQYYRPRSERWPALPSYDAVLRELFRPV